MRVFDDRLLGHAHGVDHQQAQIAHELGGERRLVDRVALDVETQALALQAATVGEVMAKSNSARFLRSIDAVIGAASAIPIQAGASTLRACCGGVAYDRRQARRSWRAEAKPARSAMRSMSRRV